MDCSKLYARWSEMLKSAERKCWLQGTVDLVTADFVTLAGRLETIMAHRRGAFYTRCGQMWTDVDQ